MKEILLNLERELSFRKDGEETNISLRINKLYFDDQKKQWRCDWSLDHLYPEAVHFPGDDPLAALSRTLDFASSFIRASTTDGAEVRWQHDGDLGGLSFPQSESGLWKLPAQQSESDTED